MIRQLKSAGMVLRDIRERFRLPGRYDREQHVNLRDHGYQVLESLWKLTGRTVSVAYEEQHASSSE